LSRLEDLAVDCAAQANVDVAVHHLANLERAETLAEHLRERIPALGVLYVSEVSAVVGAHVGPGMLAVVVSPT
jgi:fatty acid-binding protein DegV